MHQSPPEKQTPPTNHPFLDRQRFLGAIANAVSQTKPLAAGRKRDGRHWMRYQLALKAGVSGLRLNALETALKYHCLVQNRIYPITTEFILKFNEDYAESLRELDFYALKGIGTEASTLRAYQIQSQLISFDDLYPDRSPKADDERNCYLHSFAGKRVLLVSPIADLLAERANQPTFEGVWNKIGKSWFFPSDVIPVEIPYAMANTTRQTYSTVLDLCDHIMENVSRESFDIAIIGASGLGIPLAARIKRLGKVAISIGSDLQVLFGVRGKRWRERDSWRHRYFNDFWIDVPPKYFIPEKDVMVEGGAYWWVAQR